mgnify:CR=1 FL=1
MQIFGRGAMQCLSSLLTFIVAFVRILSHRAHWEHIMKNIVVPGLAVLALVCLVPAFNAQALDFPLAKKIFQKVKPSL